MPIIFDIMGHIDTTCHTAAFGDIDLTYHDLALLQKLTESFRKSALAQDFAARLCGASGQTGPLDTEILTVLRAMDGFEYRSEPHRNSIKQVKADLDQVMTTYEWKSFTLAQIGSFNFFTSGFRDEAQPQIKFYLTLDPAESNEDRIKEIVDFVHLIDQSDIADDVRVKTHSAYVDLDRDKDTVVVYFSDHSIVSPFLKLISSSKMIVEDRLDLGRLDFGLDYDGKSHAFHVRDNVVRLIEELRQSRAIKIDDIYKIFAIANVIEAQKFQEHSGRSAILGASKRLGLEKPYDDRKMRKDHV